MELDDLSDVRVLLIDDDEDDYLIIKRIFSQIPDSPFILSWTSSFENAKRLIYEGDHDIYLVDYRLGAHTGLDVLEYAQPEKRSEPFIVLTGMGNQSLELRSLKLAASDYLVKGSFDAQLLSRTLYYALQRKRIEAQRIDHLVELSRSKDEFISIASHQLRTPATGVKQYLGMVLEGFAGDVTSQQRQLLEKAYDSNERQLRIVADLLKVAQVDAGKVLLRKSDVSINHLLKDIIKELQTTLTSRHQKLVFEPLKTDDTIAIDQDTIRMVFENIIDNASKYSEEKKTVTVTVTDKENGICISIADEGVGIDENSQTRLFEKFSRLNNPLSTKVGGTGLGLYWAKKIVDLHGGTIGHSPRKPHGTEFHICLPKAD